jgi:hypothetical protein
LWFERIMEGEICQHEKSTAIKEAMPADGMRAAT